MGSSVSSPSTESLRLEQPPGLEDVDPSLIEHERLRQESISASHNRAHDGTTEKPARQTRWDRFVTESSRRVLNFTPSWFSVNIGILYASSYTHSVCVVRFTGQTHEPQDVTGAWLLPPIANIVCSASGAIVAGYLDERRAIITVIVSYILWGIGFGPTLLIKALYFYRLAMFKGAFAILRLSSVVRTLCHNRAARGPTRLYSSEELRFFGSAIYAATIPCVSCDNPTPKKF
ncbi:hypothetical protein QFC22_004509 [Naganishia vaughanmartiniae]|uniref:Uncharacterized protein n=1 Tax=Naganishia vaughanmartiniae TaxID=1424756 RepID=A0ACC2X255_9TREE|nr:hypothetical protein QFC22_004509 [Naganishia vaughanmartiniae]